MQTYIYLAAVAKIRYNENIAPVRKCELDSNSFVSFETTSGEQSCRVALFENV